MMEETDYKADYNTTASAQEPEKTGEVQIQAGRLRKVSAEVSEQVNALRLRLSTVLLPVSPNLVPDDASAWEASPLAHQLAEVAVTLEAAIVELRDMYKRVQL